MTPVRSLAYLLAWPTVSIAVVALLVVIAPWSVQGVAPIVVNSDADVEVADAECTLREAIIAANMNQDPYNGCTGAGGSPDSIHFALTGSTPVINTLSALPIIADPVLIDGNTGGASRVELRGPGGTLDTDYNGLEISSTAPGTTVSNLVINSFPGRGIAVEATDVTILANRIGTNAGGTAAMPNNGGVYASASATGIQIGDATGTTFGAACSGHCNLISGNIGDGITVAAGADDAVVQSNFLGTNLSGNAQVGNTRGISAYAAGLTLGGAGSGEGNVISGNQGGVGVWLEGPMAVVAGNYVGTNSAGTAVVANTKAGMEILNSDGTIIGPGNVVSGNEGDGIDMKTSPNIQLFGNKVGTGADGVTPMGNEFPGLHIHNTIGMTVGGTGPGEANIIAFNRTGIRVENDGAPATGNTIRGNSIHHHTDFGINNVTGGNNELPPPMITGIGPVTGTACAGCIVDVYSDDDDEGETYHGSTTASGAGNWSYNGAVVGPHVTATATDDAGNTSQFSAPFVVTDGTPTPTPIPTPSSPTGSPRPTATPTPSPTPLQTPAPTFPPPPTILGDTDCDGDVDFDDVVIILLAAASLPGGESCSAAVGLGAQGIDTRDTDCDPDVDGFDALLVLRYLVELPELPLPVECPAVGQPIS